ncbi:XdhC family protein [Microbispora hainanensis]|jgi:xanthine/CO dehydrogenase XdhC/CoxF family maturation factor|uniref:XdhC family protein n=1 Tax=Microbispora hainanensis TaxID=568844 RepID=A0ABZ1SUA2_9ACTN|nr:MULTISPECIES: XdhC family protein [Microbispora]NJP24392.1 XdhC/CoxF family protein [Microbispora sp. CL1-1]TQS14546.1 xanthine dehydrogenase [Microbispora sp. SCL1-1]
MSHSHDEDPACAAAHGDAPPEETERRTLVAVFASPVADHLLRFGVELGFRPILLEPDPDRGLGGLPAGSVEVVREAGGHLDGTADVVVTDHHRAEIGPILRDVLRGPARWIGIMGSPRHEGPHVRALTELGVPPEEIARVHRPIGLNIGSRTPAEIAVATLAGLIADRNGRPGGFAH